MQTRIRNTWKNRRHATLEQRANVLAYNIWQLALAAAVNLHQEQYHYYDDAMRVGVIREYMIFLVHVADRLTHQRFDQKQRHRFITQLANDTARQLQRNQEQAIARGEYKQDYINELNQQLEVYAATRFGDGMPGYSMLRTLARQIQSLMGEDQTNKWVIDQIMEIDAPDAARQTRDSLHQILEDWDPAGAQE